MIATKLKTLKNNFKNFKIDGYVVPKNDEFFSEYDSNNRLKTISNFSGSAGYAVILKDKNFLFVDGRYTLQAQLEAGKNFKIKNYQEIYNCKLFKNLTLGVDPKLFTSSQLKKIFLRFNRFKPLETNLIDLLEKNSLNNKKPFFSLRDNITGINYKKKINKVVNYLTTKKLDYIFVTAPENVAWLMNIRGFDNPNSPVPNCRLLLSKKRKIYIVAEKKKVSKLIGEGKIRSSQVIETNNFNQLLSTLKKGKISIDEKTCSLYYENILLNKFKLIKKEDPIYFLKAVKNKKEIDNMIQSHIIDGVALTKFLYWIKNINKKKITEYDAQNKLQKFRKLNTKYLYPSFNTIAGSGKNAAIIHYRASKKNAKVIEKNEIFLCDSGGQYKYGTTDVTRTICFNRPKKNIKNIFTKVLKGHIAVANTKINSFRTGNLIDFQARKFLRKINLDYQHGTGHGVGFFLNVHEGPQSLSKLNKTKILEGMVLSNEPGYYKKGKFGIRIENLLYVKKIEKKIFFKNLTLVPIEKDLIDFEQLTFEEKNYLFRYHLEVYVKLSKYLNKREKKWLASFI